LLTDGRHPAPLVFPASAKAAADPKAKVDDGKLKVLPQKLTGSRSRVTPKQEEAASTKFSRAAATEKVKTRSGSLATS